MGPQLAALQVLLQQVPRHRKRCPPLPLALSPGPLTARGLDHRDLRAGVHLPQLPQQHRQGRHPPKFPPRPPFIPATRTAAPANSAESPGEVISGALVGFAVSAVIVGLLLYGLKKERPTFLIPHLVIQVPFPLFRGAGCTLPSLLTLSRLRSLLHAPFPLQSHHGCGAGCTLLSLTSLTTAAECGACCTLLLEGPRA